MKDTQFSDEVEAEIKRLMEDGNVLGAQRLILDELDKQGDSSFTVAIHRLRKATQQLEKSIVDAFLSLTRGTK